MSQFSEAFLLLFVQVSIGGLLSLSVTPFESLGSGFYKSTGAVFLCFAVFSVLGRLLFFPDPLGQFSLFRFLPLLFFVLSFALYLFALWREKESLTARSYALGFFSGLLTLIVAGIRYQLAPFLSFESLVYPLSFVLSALSIGSVIATMLLGHWYLIDPDISIGPFRRLFRFFLIVLFAQIVWESVMLGGLQLFGSDRSREGVLLLLSKQRLLFLTRVLVTQLGTLVLSFFIWKTLEIPHTMAATGLLYIAVLFVAAGEILGKWLFVITSLPL